MLTYLDTGYEQEFHNVVAVAEEGGGVAGLFETILPTEPGQPAEVDVWAKHVNADGSLGGPTAVPPVANPPVGPSLRLNHFRYSLPGPSEVEARLYDILGRERLTHRETVLAAGSYILPFDTKSLPSGIYLLWLRTKYGEAVGKVAIIK